MTASMTAFSRHQRDCPEGRLIWEIRSVNHRYLDIHLKLPDDLRAVEPGCRELINDRLGRGRIDAALRFEPAPQAQQLTGINVQSVEALGRALETVAAIVPRSGEINPCDILRWPGVLEQPATDYDTLSTLATELLDETLGELAETRRREGARLAGLIGQRVGATREILANLRTALPDIEKDLKTRWHKRLSELGDEVDSTRIAQEQALLLTRADIDEELDRLDTHLTEVDRILAGTEPAGRRLDFLMQELNREANTLGSKASDLRNTNAAVDLKVLIDQMREQVQNIE
jgi:uncharacterized protein (TIGR00255 family)